MEVKKYNSFVVIKPKPKPKPKVSPRLRLSLKLRVYLKRIKRN